MKVTDSGKDFEKCPEGTHQAVCVDVVDLGLVDYSYQGVPKGKRREVRFVYQVDARDEDGSPLRDEDGKMFLVFSKFTASLAQNARLGPHLEAWLGRSLPPEIRKAGFDLEALIGRNAQVVVIHAEKDGKTYANIKGILPIAKSTAKLVPEDYVRVKDREGYEPPYGSEEWERRQEQAQGGKPVAAGAVDDDDDLPF